MVWCSYCGRDQPAEVDEANGFTCCTGCGRVLDDTVYSNDPTFTKGAGGQSQVEGNFVADGQVPSGFGRLGGARGNVFGYQADSHEKTVSKGKYEIVDIAERLGVRPRDDLVNAAHRLYRIAVQHSFTRGRRTAQVAGACLYIVCRQERKPYLLIDFSDTLQTNVYVLGAVFLQLCRLLRLEQHTLFSAPVDPSLFIHRFADRLQFGRKMHAVANTALRLVAAMKRDWLQTGRRPSGICGAALWIAAHIHGFERSKRDVVREVHVCEATLKKRLVEFESTESGSLTAGEFEARAREVELQSAQPPLSLIGLKQSAAAAAAAAASPMGPTTSHGGLVVAGKEVPGASSEMQTQCEHKAVGAAHFAHGLCRPCYDQFVQISGGLVGGSAPPAFQRAEGLRAQASEAKLALAAAAEAREEDEEDDSDVEEDVPLAQLVALRPGSRKGKKSLLGTAAAGQGRRGSGRRVGGGETSGPAEEGGKRAGERGPAGGGAASARLEQELDEALGAAEMRHLAVAHALDVPATPSGAAALSLQQRKAQARVTSGGGAPSNASTLGPRTRETRGGGEGASLEAAEERCGMEGVEGIHGGSTFGSDAQAKGQVGSDSQDHGVPAGGTASPGRQPPGKAGEEGALGEAVKGSSVEGDGQEKEEEKEEEDTLSDIDDAEVGGYLLEPSEVKAKTLVWMELNKEYLAEQEAKKAALAATEEAHAKAMEAASSQSAGAAEIAAAAAMAVEKMKMERRQRRAEDPQGSRKKPARSAAEATHKMLSSRKMSSKVNYTALASLFSEDAGRAPGQERGGATDQKGTLTASATKLEKGGRVHERGLSSKVPMEANGKRKGVGSDAQTTAGTWKSSAVDGASSRGFKGAANQGSAGGGEAGSIWQRAKRGRMGDEGLGHGKDEKVGSQREGKSGSTEQDWEPGYTRLQMGGDGMGGGSLPGSMNAGGSHEDPGFEEDYVY